MLTAELQSGRHTELLDELACAKHDCDSKAEPSAANKPPIAWVDLRSSSPQPLQIKQELSTCRTAKLEPIAATQTSTFSPSPLIPVNVKSEPTPPHMDVLGLSSTTLGYQLGKYPDALQKTPATLVKCKEAVYKDISFIQRVEIETWSRLWIYNT